MLYAATAPLFVGVYGEPLRSPIMIACYDHIVTSSTIIPVGLAVARAAIAAMRMRPFMTNLRVQPKNDWFHKQRPKAGPVSGAPQLKLQFNPAAVAASVELNRDLWRQVFGLKKQDRARSELLPNPVELEIVRATRPERGGGAARHDTSRAVLNFIGSCLYCRCRQRINHPNVCPRSCCLCRSATSGACRSSGPTGRSTTLASSLPKRPPSIGSARTPG
jgi:hypothetical protein